MQLEFGSTHDTKWQKVLVDNKQMYRKVFHWKLFLMLERDFELTQRYIQSITYYLLERKRVTPVKCTKPPFLLES